MEVSYNLRYQKQNFSNRVLIDKEGEVVIYAKGFRLKGKGAGDKGELINFSEIKEFYYRNEKLFFITFNKEKYTLADVGTQFEQMLNDLYKARNEFLMDALFMKGGKIKAEFEGHFNRTSKFGNLINKGRAKFRLYERSMVVIPHLQDCFSIQYSFVNFHEFEDFDYTLKVVMDDGTNIVFSQMGNDYEFFEEKLNAILGGMYECLINDLLKVAFPHFHTGTLLKLASKMKGGKAINMKEIKKIDDELEKEVEEFIFEDEGLKAKMACFDEIKDEKNTYVGIAKDDTVNQGYIRWMMVSLPTHNLVGFLILPRWQEGKVSDAKEKMHTMYFYKIIMERGNVAEKLEDKIKEIEQALVTLNFIPDPCYKDKRELRHSPYQYAIRKLPYLRILRKSYAGKVSSTTAADWQKQLISLVSSANNEQF